MRSIDRYGRFVLLTVFVVLLGGRFSLDRLGPFPAWDLRLIAAVLIGFLCLAWATVARERTDRVALGWVAGWFTAWAGYMALTGFWAPEGARVGDNVVDMLLLLALVWAGWGSAARIHPTMLGSAWWWLYAAGIIYFAGAAAGSPDEQDRWAAFGGGPNVFVRIMALGVLAALFLAITRRTRAAYLSLVGLPFFLYGAYMSGSRGGLLALVLVVMVGGWPLLRRTTHRMRVNTGLVIFPIAMLAPFLDWSWVGAMRDRFFVQTFQEGYDSGRTDILERALELFDEHLWIGTGIDGFFALQGYATNFQYPHNLVAASAAEGGLIGLLLVVGALLAGLVAIRSLRPLSSDALGFALAALFMLVASMFSGDYYDSRFLWFFLGLAVIAARSRLGGDDLHVAGAEPDAQLGLASSVVTHEPGSGTDSRW